MKEHTNKTHCPSCSQEWDLCECDDLYPESDLIDCDDLDIESGFNIY